MSAPFLQSFGTLKLCRTPSIYLGLLDENNKSETRESFAEHFYIPEKW